MSLVMWWKKFIAGICLAGIDFWLIEMLATDCFTVMTIVTGMSINIPGRSGCYSFESKKYYFVGPCYYSDGCNLLLFRPA